MYNDIVAALEHIRDAARGYIQAVDQFVEQEREVNAGELAQIEQHWERISAARAEYERAVGNAEL